MNLKTTKTACAPDVFLGYLPRSGIMNYSQLIKKSLSLPTLAVVSLGLALSSAAQAASVTYTDSAALPNDVSTALSLTKFDSTLGTLTGVSVSFQVTLLGANVQLDNDSQYSQKGTAQVRSFVNSFNSSVTLLKSDFSSINSGDLQINASQVFTLAPTSGDAVGQFNAVTGQGDYAAWSPGALSASASGNIADAVWGQYTGIGSFTLSLNSAYFTTASFDGENGFFQGNTPTATFSASVTYTYTPATVAVPEPSTYAMIFGVVALGACVARRRLRKA